MLLGLLHYALLEETFSCVQSFAYLKKIVIQPLLYLHSETYQRLGGDRELLELSLLYLRLMVAFMFQMEPHHLCCD